MSLLKRLHLQIVLPIVLLGSFSLIHIFHHEKIEPLQLKVFDSFQKLHPREYIEAPVLIVDIDDASLEKFGQWPWPRILLSQLINKLNQAKVNSIALDIVFSEPDRYGTDQLLELWSQNTLSDGTVTELENLPNPDKLFAETISQGNVIGGFSLTPKENNNSPQLKSGFAFLGPDPTDIIPPFQGSVSNIRELESQFQGNGSFNIIAESDGIIRRVPLVFNLKGQLHPSLMLEMIRAAQGASTHLIQTVEEDNHKAILGIKSGNIYIPTNLNGHFWIHDTGLVPERSISAKDILDDKIDTTTLQNKFIIIGTSAEGLKDIRATPLHGAVPGVTLHAQILEQILSGHFLIRPDWAHGAEFLYMLFLSLLLLFLLRFTAAFWAAFLGVLFVGLIFIFSFYAFVNWQWLFDPVLPSLGALIIYFSSSFIKHLETEQEKNQIRTSFGRYLSPALVKRLVKDSSQMKLGGESKEMTILFSDIRNFTTLSEKMSPQELTQLLNNHLTPMTDIILQHGGTIDKYIGDAIMAFWNAPLENVDHKSDALRAAIAMNNYLSNHSGQSAPFEIGIGINSGPCVVGNMGSEQRFSYTAIGDTVNLASRIESLTKHYGIPILVGGNAFVENDSFSLIEIDTIQVKGKSEVTKLYTPLLGNGAADRGPNNLGKNIETFLRSYRGQHWENALTQLTELEKSEDEVLWLGNFAKIYRDRIESFKSNPPEDGWNGVTKMDSKE